ncbi:MAG TPA: YdcF family protein [Hyphomicrobiaceae bacterium]|nr:YdcF family protein [Hyphomicrobiaceae bacterium]
MLWDRRGHTWAEPQTWHEKAWPVMRAMSRLWRFSAGAAGIAAAAFLLGFFIFATIATRELPPRTQIADGIVVLTGGASRIEAAARLFEQGKAKRLFVSGVNRITRKSDLKRLMRISSELFTCCVDLGYAAQNTRGNAEETRAWQQTHGFGSLIVVTASYHMPRSLAELAREMPGVTLIPHPVLPRTFRANPWWLDASNARILAHEYLKFLPSAVHYGVTRLVTPAHSRAAPGAPQHAGTDQ